MRVVRRFTALTRVRFAPLCPVHTSDKVELEISTAVYTQFILCRIRLGRPSTKTGHYFALLIPVL